MKKSFHVFCHKFAELAARGEHGRTKVNVLVILLLALLAAPSVWASSKYIYNNGEAVVTPCSGTNDISTSDVVRNFVIYDDGGASGNYSNSCKGYNLITAPKGYGIKVWGWVKAEYADSLYIKDDRYNTNIIARINGAGVNSQRDFGPYYSTCDGMNISFITDGSVVGPGFELHVEFVPLRTVSANANIIWLYNPYSFWGPSGASSTWIDETYSEGMKVPFTLNGNYNDERVWGIKLRKKDGSGIVGYQKNDSTGRYEFVMPSSDVGIVIKQDWDSAGYNMFNDEKTLYLYGTRKIKLYDEGGPEDDYASNFDGWVKLSTPEGFYFKVTGTIETEAGGYDYLEIYDGEVSKGTSATWKCKVYPSGNGNSTGRVDVPSNCVSTAEYMTLHFHTDGSYTASGLDLSVSSEYRTYSVKLHQTSNGSISSDAYSSQKGSKVTLTVKPNSGYVLKGVEVVNKTTGFSYTYGDYRSNQVTFSMPASDVDVTPTFVKDTYSITKKTVTGGSVSGASSAKVGSTVTMTTSAASGYLYKGASIEVNESHLTAFGEKGFLDGKFSFTMPIGDVTVTPLFTSDWSAEGGLFINMIKAKKYSVTIPSGVKSFKVYDNGGKDGYYSNNSSDTLVLNAPSGCVLQLSGSVITASGDSLLVYNGSGAYTNSLLGTYGGSSQTISNVLSSGNYMTLLLNSDGSSYSSGLDLTVKVLPVVNQITYTNKNSGGTVTSDAPKTAKKDSVINYTYSYNSGYMVSEITAVDADGKSVRVSGGWYNDKKASFKMPLAAVTVTSTYTSNWSAEGGLYIDMRKSSKFTATIPSGVKSFKVYDNGGKDGYYSSNSSDTLVLNAPSGYVLQLSGSTNNMSSYYDSLLVYNGSRAYASNLLGTYKGSSQAISNVLSSGTYMTLVFHSGSSTNTGFDLTVSVIPIVHQITYVNKNSGGTVTSDAPKTAKKDSIVTYTYSYSSGYVVKEIKAVDDDGNSVTVSGGWYNDRKASFKMPLSAVTVTSTYTDDLSAEGGLFINMSKASKVTATIPSGVNSFKVYDNGGKDGYYSTNSSDTLVLKAPAGYVLQLSGNLTTCGGTHDSLRIYNGTSINANSLLGTYRSTSSGSAYAITNVLSSGVSMTILFHSDSYGNRSGFDLTVSVIPIVHQITYVNKNSGGTVTSDAPKTGKKDSIVTYTYSYSSGYVVKEIKAVDDDGNSVTVSGGWYNDRKASFKMPLSAVTVTSTYTDDLSAEGGLYINMLKTSKVTAMIPSGVKSFKVYDNGGKDGYYSTNSSDTLVLKAPAGYVLQLSGNLTTCGGTHDSLRIYNGTSINANSLLGTYRSTSSGSAYAITNVLSSGVSMTLLFHSDSYGNRTGFDLTVSVIPIVHQITYTNDNSGGSVTSDSPKTGKKDSIVTYTYSYDSGYMVSEIKAVDDDGKSVTVTGGWYNDRKASFKMPLSAVTVASTYTDDLSAEGGLYINMLKTSKVTATIPSGVKSFKVYDNGGKDGYYSTNSSDTLVLKAPAGYVLQLSGNLTTCGGTHDSLRIYNGTLINANSLLGTYRSTSSGSAYAITNVLSSDVSMTLLFHSDSYGNRSGINLTVNVIPIVHQITYTNDNSGGSVTSDSPKTGKKDSIVTYTYSYDSGYMVSEIKAVDDDGKNVTVTGGWYNDRKASFKMPLSAVTVTSTYTDDLSAEGGLFINMSKASKVTATIPSGVKSFKVYDNGGKDGYYSINSSDTLVLKAPSGYVLQLSGNLTTCGGTHDSLRIYNGTLINANSLLGTYRSTSSGSAYAITNVLSSGESMTLLFHSDSYGNRSGINLTVKVVDFAIVANSATGGTIKSDNERSVAGKPITLTAYPQSGYMFSGVTVKDASQNVVKSNNSSFTTAVFTMPASDVNVTPVFTKAFTAAGGLHLDFVRNKKNEVDVPSGVTSFKIYDNGGKDNNYEKSSRDTIVLKAPDGYRLTVTGNIKTEKGWDSLYVFDGANTNNENKLFGASSSTANTETSVGSISSTGEYMTLRFKSDGSNEYEGLDLTVTLEKINYTITLMSVTGGTLYSNVTKATYGTEVSLNGIPTSGYRLSEATYVTASGASAVALMHSFDRAVFTMPASNVDVFPTWTTNLTAEGGIRLDMPRNVKADVNIPSNIKSFNLYDNGGKSGQYANSSKDTLTLNAPTGFYLVVTGSITLETGCDSLYIFDGKNTSAAKLFGGTSTSRGSSYSIPTITSSGESLTFRFKSDGSVVYSGLNLKISVVPITYGITIAEVDHGRVSSDKTKAAKDSIVVLSWVYTTGYLIRDIDVKDASNNKVVVNGGWYSGAKASFVMPESPVTVTPSFTNNLTASSNDGLYINMPQTGTIDATIPNNVVSFKVYDDGGAGGEYSNYVDGTLVLTAPEGTQLKLSGSVVTEKPSTSGDVYDYLEIYDGFSNKANLIRKATSSVTIDGIRSTGNGMTLFFHSDGGNVRSGLDLTVTVIKPVHLLKVADIPQQSYTGDSIKPVLTIMDGSAQLVENRNYRLQYINNVNSGTATVGIIGRGSYIGDTAVTFTIGPKVTQFAAVNILEDQRGKGVAIDGSYSGDEAIMITDSIEVDYVDYSRKFSTSGFSTIVLPFDVNTSNVSGLKKVAAFSEIRTNDDGRLVAVMSLVWKDSVGVPDTTLKANTPYMVLMNDGKFAVDGGVTLVPTVEPVVRSGDWEFRGTLAKRVWAAGDSDLGHVYGFSAEERPEQNIKIGQFVKAAAGAWIRPGRAYLINVPEEQGNHVGAGRPAIAALPSVFLPEEMDVVIEDKENGSTTFVGRFNARTGEFVNMKARTYDLKGRNVNGSRAKGMFIRK